MVMNTLATRQERDEQAMAGKKKVTIKDTVFRAIHKSKGKLTYEEITAIVKPAFPGSKWQKSHWAWYRYQIRKGRFVTEFSATERRNLTRGKEPERIETNDIKVIGDGILNHVRFVLDTVASEDDDLRFKLNRWVFGRLQQDERKTKRPIKKQLWEMGERSCSECGKVFEELKGIELHRKDTDAEYSLENCVLLHRGCHQKVHGKK